MSELWQKVLRQVLLALNSASWARDVSFFCFAHEEPAFGPSPVRRTWPRGLDLSDFESESSPSDESGKGDSWIGHWWRIGGEGGYIVIFHDGVRRRGFTSGQVEEKIDLIKLNNGEESNTGSEDSTVLESSAYDSDGMNTASSSKSDGSGVVVGPQWSKGVKTNHGRSDKHVRQIEEPLYLVTVCMVGAIEAKGREPGMIAFNHHRTRASSSAGGKPPKESANTIGEPEGVNNTNSNGLLNRGELGRIVAAASSASVSERLNKKTVDDMNAAPGLQLPQYVVGTGVDHVVVEPVVPEQRRKVLGREMDSGTECGHYHVPGYMTQCTPTTIQKGASDQIFSHSGPHLQPPTHRASRVLTASVPLCDKCLDLVEEVLRPERKVFAGEMGKDDGFGAGAKSIVKGSTKERQEGDGGGEKMMDIGVAFHIFLLV
ncbi:hypothetical protein C8R46DRAFT_1035809 [Mycena filopes]|nr:hypothetical protein C8R46DRAFT_1035809 [Mycena filopes]